MKHLRITTSFVLSLAAFASLPSQAALSPTAQYKLDKEQALITHRQDKSLCADLDTSAKRLQCMRDSKVEYDKALVQAKATFSASVSTAPATAPATATSTATTKPQPLCQTCGKVVAVNVQEREGEGGAVGVIAGGLAGAALGNQIGKGSGRTIATIAGAAGGAYAGKTIEGKVKTNKVWVVQVQFQNGQNSTYEFNNDPALAVGDKVQSSGNSVVRY